MLATMQMDFTDYLNSKEGVERYIRRISYNETKPFILDIHYARRMPCITDAFGLFLSGNLIGVCTFGQPASPTLCTGIAGEAHKNDVLELNRLVILPKYNGMNYASYLVSHALKMLPNYTFVVSYADYGGWGHIGYVYQATNFYYLGKNNGGKMLLMPNGIKKHPRLLGIYRMRHPELKDYTTAQLLDLLGWRFTEGG